MANVNESSTENQQNNISFRVNPYIILKLKLSIKALCDSEFNPQGVGRMDVTAKGFELTVCNAVTHVVGHLFLDASDLLNFHCSKPIVSKMISLNQVSEFLKNDNIGDSVTVVHLHELSTKLSFSFGYDDPDDPGNESSIEFLDDNDAEFEKFPGIKFSCEAVLESLILRKLIDQLKKTEGSQLVSAFISEHRVIITIPQETPLKQAIKYNGYEAKVSKPGEKYHAWFELHHLTSIMQASAVAPFSYFHLRFLTEPPGNVMIRFNLSAGDLVFIQKAILISKDGQLASSDMGATSAEQMHTILHSIVYDLNV